MRQMLLSTDGFSAGSLWVPPFRIGRGESVQIVLSSGAHRPALSAALTGASPTPGLTHGGNVRQLVQAWDSRGPVLRRLTPAPRAADWVARAAGVTRAEGTALLNDVGFDLDPRIRLGVLPGNYRNLLGLAVAIHHKPDVIVFTGAATDWTGRQWLIREIGRRLDRWAAVEIASPFWCEGREHIDPPLLPNSTVIEAESHPVPLSA